ncbi:MAG: hypothetical protein EOP42_21130 [Sphingobacteriaceae bacterium]|nr:MAG: hypothetical protein EOP42_21130 [Sphingobacteriaceae bacterium]
MLKKSILFILLLSAISAVKAQDSVIPDISYPFLDKLITSAKNNYPRVKAYQHRENLAKINISQAKISWFDLFTVSYIYQPNSTLFNQIPASNATTTYNRFLFNGIQAGVSVNLGSLLSKPYHIKTAKEELKVVNEEQNEYLITLTADVKHRYFTYLLQQNLLKLQTQSYQDFQTLLKQTKYKFQKGETTFEVYNAALLSASTRTEQKMLVEANFFIAKSELEAIIGAKLEDLK